MSNLFHARSLQRNEPKMSKQEIYCEIVSQQVGLLKKKIQIEVDFGDPKGIFGSSVGDVLCDDETGKKIEFNSMIDALNYMSSQGWLFVNAYSMLEKEEPVYHYIMKKIVDKQSVQDKS